MRRRARSAAPGRGAQPVITSGNAASGRHAYHACRRRGNGRRTRSRRQRAPMSRKRRQGGRHRSSSPSSRSLRASPEIPGPPSRGRPGDLRDGGGSASTMTSPHEPSSTASSRSTRRTASGRGACPGAGPSTVSPAHPWASRVASTWGRSGPSRSTRLPATGRRRWTQPACSGSNRTGWGRYAYDMAVSLPAPGGAAGACGDQAVENVPSAAPVPANAGFPRTQGAAISTRRPAIRSPGSFPPSAFPAGTGGEARGGTESPLAPCIRPFRTRLRSRGNPTRSREPVGIPDFSVIPAKAWIQNCLKRLDSGSSPE